MNKQILFLIILLTAAMVKAGNHAEPTIELQGIENGKTYESPIKLNFIVKNIKVLPAGVKEENSGHHHILLNLSELPNLNSPLPMTENIIHFGKGQTSTSLDLEQGKHTIQLLFADYSHTPHKVPLMTKKITFYIK
tara:strand:+ start:48 stop:455 length:408 start_codon:yes stop_codon:yes gene_type:complete